VSDQWKCVKCEAPLPGSPPSKPYRLVSLSQSAEAEMKRTSAARCEKCGHPIAYVEAQ
jgi:ribosomal protein L34E